MLYSLWKITEFYPRNKRPENSPFVDDRIFISQQDNTWDTTKCGSPIATANKLLCTTSLLLVFNTTLPLLLTQTTTPSTAQQKLCHTASYHESISRELVHRQETESKILCLAGHSRAAFKGRYEQIQYLAIQAGCRVYQRWLFKVSCMNDIKKVSFQ